VEREQERGQKGTPTEKEPSNSEDDDTPARRGTREHTRHKPPTTNGPHDKIMGEGGGGGGGARGAGVGERTKLRGERNRRPKAVGALQQSKGWKITTRKHHGRKPKPMMNHNVRINSTSGRRLRWRYPEANHDKWWGDGSAELHGEEKGHQECHKEG
jgi:hypothetical protein